MINLSIDKYLEDFKFIYNKKLEIKHYFFTEFSNSVKLINIFIEVIDRLICYNLKSLNRLENTIFEFIKRNNDNLSPKEYELYEHRLKKVFDDIQDEFRQCYSLNIFFYGNNTFGLIENKLLNYNIIKIKNEKELKSVSIKKDSIDTNVYNVLLVENDILFKNNFFDKILNYSQISSLFLKAAENIYKYYYDFNYLNNSLKRSYKDDVESIIVGNSYSLVGIKEDLLNQRTVNLSMHSQDLYYSFKLAKNTILENGNIKQCIFGMSYYILHHDLSRGNSLYSKNMIENVYYPLLNDRHNSTTESMKNRKSLNDYELDILIENIFNINEVEKYFKDKIYNENTMYYNSINYVNRQKRFSDFNKGYKEQLGLLRAEQHNKIFKYSETESEYKDILKEFLKFLYKHSIQVIIVIFPTSRYYSKNIKLEYRQLFDNLLNKIKKENDIKVIDLRNSLFEFDDTDFIDADHLNEKGAIKATNYLNEFIKGI